MKHKFLTIFLSCTPFILSSQIIDEDFESCSAAPDCNIMYDALSDGCYADIFSLTGIPILTSTQCDYEDSCDLSEFSLAPILGDESLILHGQFFTSEASGLVFNVGDPLKYGSRLIFSCRVLNPISADCMTAQAADYGIRFGTNFSNNTGISPQNSFYDLHFGAFDAEISDSGDTFNTEIETVNGITTRFQIDTPNEFEDFGPFDQVLIVRNPPDPSAMGFTTNTTNKYVHIFDNIKIQCDIECPMIETNVQPLIDLDPNDDPLDLCGNILEINVALESRCNNLSLSDIPYNCEIKDADTGLEITSFMSNSDYHRIVLPPEIKNIEWAFTYGDNGCLYPHFNNKGMLSIPQGPVELSGNTTNDMYFPNGAIVLSGTTATINNRLEFGSGTGLRIQSGASVVLGSGAILTSCEGIWRGISMTANSSLSSNNGATIEFAKTGISQRGQNNGCNNLNVINTTFDGCGTGVFMSNSAPLATNNIFNSNTFINTNIGIRNRNLLGLEILNNPRIDCAENGYLSFNGSATIEGNTFGGSSIGINLNNIFNPMDHSLIQGNTFLPSCSIGIQIEGGSPNNGPIEISDLNWFQASDVGIVVIGNSRVRVDDNIFLDEEIGVRFIDSGFQFNRIQSNEFINLTIGILTESINPALSFTSNCFHNTRIVDTACENDIDPQIGDANFGASNCFSETAIIDFVFGGLSLQYFLPFNDPNFQACLDPFGLPSLFKFSSDNAGSCDTPPGFINNGGICSANNNYSAIKSKLRQVVTDVEQLKCKENLSYAEKLEIRALRKCIQKLLNLLVDFVNANDSLSDNHIITPLNQLNNFDTRFFLINYLISNGLCGQARSLVNNMETCEERENEMKNLLHIAVNIKCGLEVEVTQSDLNQIIQLASKGNTYNGFLYSLYFQLTNERIPLPEIFEFSRERSNSRSQADKDVPDLKLFPNPFKDIINIENTNGVLDIYLYDSAGSLVLNRKIENGSHSLDLSKEIDGLYFVNITLPSGETKVFKIVKM